MGGDIPAVEADCPNCGSETRSISDCFTGRAAAVDNFDEVEDHLRERGVVSDEEFDLYADDYSREEYERVLEEGDYEPRDGPFIVERIVCTERSCTECEWSERVFTPREDVAKALAAAIQE